MIKLPSGNTVQMAKKFLQIGRSIIAAPNKVIVIREDRPSFKAPFVLLRQRQQFVLQQVELMDCGEEVLFVQRSGRNHINTLRVQTVQGRVRPVLLWQDFDIPLHKTTKAATGRRTPKSSLQPGGPVQDDSERRGHGVSGKGVNEKTLAVACNGVIYGASTAWEDSADVRLEKGLGNARHERWPSTVNFYCHDLSVRSEIKQLFTIAAPLWLRSATGRNLPLTAGCWEALNVNLVSPDSFEVYA